MSQSCFSLGFLSQNSLWKLSIFRGYKGLYIVEWERNAKSQFFPNRVVWRLGLATGLSHEFKSRANSLASMGLLSCSATAGMTLQLLVCLAHVQLLAACKPRVTHEIQSRVLASLHNLEHFFTLSHTLPLHDSHLKTGLLIAKIQANLAQNKANKMVDKISTLHPSINNFYFSLLLVFYFRRGFQPGVQSPPTLKIYWCLGLMIKSYHQEKTS